MLRVCHEYTVVKEFSSHLDRTQFCTTNGHNVVFLTARRDHHVAAIPNVKVQVYDEITLQPEITAQFQKIFKN